MRTGWHLSPKPASNPCSPLSSSMIWHSLLHFLCIDSSMCAPWTAAKAECQNNIERSIRMGWEIERWVGKSTTKALYSFINQIDLLETVHTLTQLGCVPFAGQSGDAAGVRQKKHRVIWQKSWTWLNFCCNSMQHHLVKKKKLPLYRVVTSCVSITNQCAVFWCLIVFKFTNLLFKLDFLDHRCLRQQPPHRGSILNTGLISVWMSHLGAAQNNHSLICRTRVLHNVISAGVMKQLGNHFKPRFILLVWGLNQQPSDHKHCMSIKTLHTMMSVFTAHCYILSKC